MLVEIKCSNLNVFERMSQRDILEEESCSVSCISGYLKMHTSIYIPVTVTEVVTQLN